MEVAGSPVTIANLWEVTDKDIDRFGKAVFYAWLRERMKLADCSQMVKEFETMKIKGRKGNSRKNVPSSDHRPKIGSSVCGARDSCTLRFLNGASPVCYGVPTGIWIRKDL
ncbi:Peptidase C50, separase [Corchorus olitorius]|uniref:Peptidase C50, separase n=1 Tax=Corchorus olitorius TaxID=93759 RepID=A0A1R3JG34_9ROSI|nr:Peptidase C50, separase [Corchorus olitorius]